MLRQHLGFILSKLNTIKLLSRIKHKNPKKILHSYCAITFPIKDLTKELIDSLLEDKKKTNDLQSNISHLYL